MKKKSSTQTQIQLFRTTLSPPNPILDESKKVNQEMLKLKLLKNNQIQLQNTNKSNRNKSLKYNNPIIQTFLQQQQQSDSLIKKYQNLTLIYKRFDNTKINKINRTAYLTSIFINPKFLIKPQSPKKNQQSTTIFDFLPKSQNIQIPEGILTFNSNFQSGNLFAAYYVGTNQYDLLLQNDINTKGNNQWFYFSVAGSKKNQSVKFNIVNLYKSHSLYSQGMRPLVFSTVANKSKNGIGWYRYGNTIRYYEGDIKIQGKNNRFYYVLSFNYKFDYDNDIVFFCHGFPYTFMTLNIFLQSLKQKYSNQTISIRSIGTTGLKKNIPMIILGNNVKEKQRKYYTFKPSTHKSKNKDDKDSIIILARQHPGQSQGSYLCQGFIKALLQLQTFQSKFMLNNFNFFIFPMINIDGVINGNYRSNIYGYDLNRNWAAQKQLKHPEVYYIKKQIEKISKFSNICLVIDFHGHSKKMNSFFFGNPNSKYPDGPKILPLLASKLSSQISFNDCTFSCSDEKGGAARIALQKFIVSQKQCNVYTFQASFYGTFKNHKKVHFTMEDYRNLGGDVFTSIFKRYSQQIKQIKTLMQSPIFKELKKQLSTVIYDQKKVDSGSDSQAEQIFNQDQIEQIQQVFSNVLNSSQQQKQLSLIKAGQQSSPQRLIKLEQSEIYTPRTISQKSNLFLNEQTQTQFEDLNFYNIVNSEKSNKKPLSRNQLIKLQIQKRKTSLFNHTLNQFNSKITEPKSTKNSINKLKIHGEKFTQRSFIKTKIIKATQTQTSYLADVEKAFGNTSYKFNTINNNVRNFRKLSSYDTAKRSATVRNFQKDLITQQVSQMIKIRKIQYKNKISVGSFRDQFALLSDEAQEKTKLPHV